MSFAGNWMQLETVMLREVSQWKKHRLGFLSIVIPGFYVNTESHVCRYYVKIAIKVFREINKLTGGKR